MKPADIFPYTTLIYVSLVRCKVPRAVSMKVTVFWGVASRSLIKIDLHFRVGYCFHRQGYEHDD
jgi:hypothetical protein